MKLHHWIIVGMVAGLTAGWLLGPDSPVLGGETVVLRPGPAAPALHLEPGGERLQPVGREVHGLLGASAGEWVELRVGSGLDRERVFLLRSEVPPERHSGLGLAVLAVLSVVGDLFLRLLKMLVVPLVLVSLTSGVASLGHPRQLGRMGLSTLGFFLTTTAVAVTIGLVAASALRPGEAVGAEQRERLGGAEPLALSSSEIPSAADRLRELVPENPIAAMASGDMLQVIFFAVMLGVALCLMPEPASRPLVRLLESATAAMVRLVHVVMLTAPLGVAALIAVVTASSGLRLLVGLAAYSGVVLLGLLVHVAAAYVPVVRLLAGVPVRAFFRAARPAQLLTFGTSSSSAALPVTMECAERGLGISRKVSAFVLPVGSTINMDGTALYQGVATVFIAQLYGLDLSAGELVQVVLMATLASVGAAGVPGAGMITLTMVLTGLGLPVEGIAVIMGVDRILDMFRSAVNVTGDLACASLVARLEGERPGRTGDAEDAFDRPAERAAGDEAAGDGGEAGRRTDR